MACKERDKKKCSRHANRKYVARSGFHFLGEKSPDPPSGLIPIPGHLGVQSGVVEKRNVAALKFQLNNYA